MSDPPQLRLQLRLHGRDITEADAHAAGEQMCELLHEVGLSLDLRWAVPRVDFMCDGCEHRQPFSEPRYGWTHRGGDDYCAACSCSGPRQSDLPRSGRAQAATPMPARRTMTETIVERDTRVKIEDARPIHVGKAAVDALREDIRAQLGDAIGDAAALWPEVDVQSLDDLQPLQYRLIAASVAVEALIHLTPVPDIDE